MNYPDAEGGSSAPAADVPCTDGHSKSKPPTRAERNPIRAIRRMCLACCGGSARLVEECPASTCALFRFRSGRNPYRTPRSGEPISAILERGTCLADTSEHDPREIDGGEA